MNSKMIAILIIIIAIFVGGLLIMSNRSSVIETASQPAAAADSLPKFVRLNKTDFLARASEPGMVLIDIRTPEEFQAGHIENATNIDFYAPDFQDKLNALNKNGRYSIYCRSGSRSGRALEMMKDLEFKDVADLATGYASI